MVVSSNGVGGEILTTKEHKRQLAEKKRFYMLIRVVITTRLYICQNSNYTFFNGYSLLYANQTSRKLLYKEKTYSYMSNLVKRSRNICITSFFLTLDLLLFIRNIFRKGLPLVSIAGKHKNFAFVKIKGKVMGKNTCHWSNSYPPLPLWTQADIRT